MPQKAGHASAAMPRDVYADLFDDDLDDVAVAHSEGATDSDVDKRWARHESRSIRERGETRNSQGVHWWLRRASIP